MNQEKMLLEAYHAEDKEFEKRKARLAASLTKTYNRVAKLKVGNPNRLTEIAKLNRAIARMKELTASEEKVEEVKAAIVASESDPTRSEPGSTTS